MDAPSTAMTLTAFLENISTFMTQIISWLGTALGFIEQHIWVLVPTVFMAVAGAIFVYIRGTIRG